MSVTYNASVISSTLNLLCWYAHKLHVFIIEYLGCGQEQKKKKKTESGKT